MKSRERLATLSRQHSTMLEICRAMYSEKLRAFGLGLRYIDPDIQLNLLAHGKGTMLLLLASCSTIFPTSLSFSTFWDGRTMVLCDDECSLLVRFHSVVVILAHKLIFPGLLYRFLPPDFVVPLLCKSVFFLEP